MNDQVSQKTLVLVHGFLGSAMNWGPILTKLRTHENLRNWTFLAVDLLGHGGRRLPKGKDSLSLAEVSEDLARQIPDGPFTALGHSFGIRPLLSFTKQFPGRIENLIVEDSSPEMSAEGYESIDAIFTGTPVPFESRDAAKQFFDQRYGVGSPMSRFLLSNIRRNDESVVEAHDWRFDVGALRGLLRDALSHPQWLEWSNFVGSIYMILGQNSKFVSLDRQQKAVNTRGAKFTQIVQIEQSGHWVHSEQSEKFTEALVKILKEIE